MLTPAMWPPDRFRAATIVRSGWPPDQFRVVLVYVIWELLATATLTIADIVVNGSAPATEATLTTAQRLYGRAYWTNDVIVDLLRFVLVIILIYKAADGSKTVLGRVLTI